MIKRNNWDEYLAYKANFDPFKFDKICYHFVMKYVLIYTSMLNSEIY